MRPAHIHIKITADNYKNVITQIYPDDDPWLETDTVFAVKDNLVVNFKPLKKDTKATLELEYDFGLAPASLSVGVDGNHLNGN